ncbi:Hypothetical protein P9303_11571 [Prochlorococcus marinus str. MIT 9303]|uniref:Uncharacterized protein n=1 Tax=Prochlorococcus marinus (strain MIT 9303) TaxID=59922 RepID=A2C8U6_PROM3|nr:Hypothetical protein P9303_11571 [Prochlorococcus marinus str. MIT 9303]
MNQYLENEESKEWEEATRTDCIKVWTPSIDGTGWKQGDVDCADRGLSPLPKKSPLVGTEGSSCVLSHFG